METRGATARYDAASDSYTLRACSQGAGPLRDQLPPSWASEREAARHHRGRRRRLRHEDRRPIRNIRRCWSRRKSSAGRCTGWRAARKPSSATTRRATPSPTPSSRSTTNGKFLALRMRHCATWAPMSRTAGAASTPTISRAAFPACTASRRSTSACNAVFTNTVPIGPYRGAGRPEANYVLERLVDEAARVTGIDPRAAAQEEPHPADGDALQDARSAPPTTAANSRRSSTRRSTLADYDGFKKRKREAAKRKKLRGIGISCFLEHAGGAPTEGAALAFPGDDTLMLGCDVQSTGQGHATVFPRLVAERLGIAGQGRAPARRHRHRLDRLCLGRLALGHDGGQRHRAHRRHDAGEGQENRRRAAGGVRSRHRLPRRRLRGGRHRPPDFAVRARRARRGDGGARRDRGKPRHQGQGSTRRRRFRTAATSPRWRSIPTPAQSRSSPTPRWTTAATCSTTRSSRARCTARIAQGLGQALVENAVYDPTSGQLVTGSFMDYGMPRAHDMPIELRERCIRCRRPPTRSASRASAKPAPRLRSPRS